LASHSFYFTAQKKPPFSQNDFDTLEGDFDRLFGDVKCILDGLVTDKEALEKVAPDVKTVAIEFLENLETTVQRFFELLEHRVPVNIQLPLTLWMF
jgi:hypothetical protein